MLVQAHAGKRFRRSSHSVRHLSTEACVVPLESLLHTLYLLIDGVRSFTRGVEAEKHQHEKRCQRQVWWSSKTLNSARLAARARPGHILQDAARLKSILFQLSSPYSGFHFLCSFFRTVADSRSFVLKLCGLLEKIRHSLPSSPISKKIRKEDQFLRKFALIRSPICGGILGMQERHVCTIQRRFPSVLLNQGATTIASYC